MIIYNNNNNNNNNNNKNNNSCNRKNMESCNAEFPSNKIHMQVNSIFVFFIKINLTEYYLCMFL